MSRPQIAGKYLAALDPSSEMAKVKMASTLTQLSPSFLAAMANPEIPFGQASPQASFYGLAPEYAFNAAGLGF
jgi:hypothetical protein